jgi:NTP pyrophosphatase (non-canonical NTP hydrolase)
MSIDVLSVNAAPACLQAQVHAMIQAIGGYWRPVNAVARLLEELAELGEELASADPEGDGQRLSAEFADLWIISTCLANQFTLMLDDDRDEAAEPDRDGAGAGFVRLVEEAGRIARVVNYYDGPKNPRSLDGFPTLTAAITSFHRALRMLAASQGVDLDAAVESKVTAATERDRGRFAVGYDPSTADSLRAFKPDLPAAQRLWGAPTWDGRLTVEHNVDLIIPFLTCFAKAAERENLDGFVIRLPDGPETGDLPALSRRLSRVLVCLAARGPRPNAAFPAEVRTPGWQFTFGGTRLRISVFSPLYPAPYSLHCEHGTFVLLQPGRV